MQQRKTYLDALRIFAIFFVIYTHVGFNCKDIFMPMDNLFVYGTSCFLSVFCRIAVPIFFMISGGLLLRKNESYKDLFKNRILRFGIVLVLFSLIVYLVQWKSRSITGFFKTLYGNKVVPSYWYLYSYIELLLLLPLLRRMAQGITKKDYLYYFILQVVFVTIFPVFETITGSSSINIIIVMTTKNIFYFMMGDFFVNLAEDSFYTKKNLIIINILGFLCVCAGCLYISLFFTEGGVVTDANLDVQVFTFTALPAFAVFFDFKYLFDRINISVKSAKVLSEIGTASFGVYLLHGILIKYTDVISDFLMVHLPAGLSGIIYSLFVIIVCTAVVIPLRKIPLINKLI